MRPEYDFSAGVRGKHHEQYKAGTNVAFLDADIAKVTPKHPTPVQPAAFSREFQELVEARQMDAARRQFDENKPFFDALLPSDRDAAELVDCAARLLDRDRSHLPWVESMLGRFTPDVRRELPVVRCGRLDLASGVLAFHQSAFNAALALFESVKESAIRNGFDDLVPVSDYYSARSDSKLGRANEAIERARAAKTNAIKRHAHPRLVAQIQMVEAWNLFGIGKVQEAADVLSSATDAFGPALRNEDYIEYCNIISFRARIALRKGDSESAIGLYTDAMRELESHEDSKRHPVYGRVLTHVAAAKLMLARKVEGTVLKGISVEERRALEEKPNRLRRAALEHLQEAERVYKACEQRRGMASVHTHRAWLYLDMGELVKGRQEAKNAYEVSTREDPYARGHALVILCQVELQDPRGDVVKARGHAEEARVLTAPISRRRLKARALIALGLTLLRPPYEGVTEAKRLYDEARKLLDEHDQDYLREEFEDFETALGDTSSQKRRIAEVLLSEALTRGLEQSLHEIEREIVLAVHRLEGGSVQRTARALQTTRNRIRRVLAADRTADVTGPTVES